MENNETKSRVKAMMEGMIYHCKEMSRFMAEHMDDPYFDTPEGKKIRESMTGICMHHALGLMCIMLSDESKAKKKDDTDDSFEQLLRDSFK